MEATMRKYHFPLVLCLSACLFLGAPAVSSPGIKQSLSSPNEQSLWSLEHAYWRYVQDNDLPAYISLWHQDFLGWPAVSPVPVHKDHITDWITSQTSKGLAFKSMELKPAAIQFSGNVALTYYWITYKLLDKDANGTTHNLRVTHTWLNDGKNWQIIGGMSMPEPATPQK
jgi:ketosteroid isomerase-like protein